MLVSRVRGSDSLERTASPKSASFKSGTPIGSDIPSGGSTTSMLAGLMSRWTTP
jgi:hypothetical protein